MATMLDHVIGARRDLEDALNERDVAQARFDAAIGTSTEMSAYERLRRAARRVRDADRMLKRAVAED
jgi:hypothetical protein